jgi:F0F1-type ATP synthase assembly protein I
MTSPPRKNRQGKVAKYLYGLTLKLGSGLVAMSLGGLLNQYIQRNPTGMLMFALLMIAGLIATTAAIVAEE